MILQVIENTENLKANGAIKRNSIKNTRNMTRQTHRQDILIRSTKVTINARDIQILRAIGKMILSNNAHI